MKIEFNTDGAGFYDEYADKVMNDIYKNAEIIRILKGIIDDIEFLGKDHGSIMDINGNKSGSYEI